MTWILINIYITAIIVLFVCGNEKIHQPKPISYLRQAEKRYFKAGLIEKLLSNRLNSFNAKCRNIKCC